MAITNQTWINMHRLVMSHDSKQKSKDILAFIQTTGIKYNMDSRSLLNKYFNFVIRHMEEDITPGFLNMAEEIVHASDDTPIECIVSYLGKSNCQ